MNNLKQQLKAILQQYCLTPWQRLFARRQTASSHTTSPIIPRAAHNLSRSQISPNALKVLYQLKDRQYSAYLVGGGVRDLLVGRPPKDFDVATNAIPEDMESIFRKSRIIGRRFKLVHVYFPNEIIEVSTFRANTVEPRATTPTDGEDHTSHPPAMVLSDNTYGTIEEDAWRRDFTVNALYYNIADFSIVDYTGGMRDLQHKLIRTIGDPTQRFHEDPVRLLRAIRLAAKLQFTFHPSTEKPLRALPHLLQHVAKARLLEEVLKLFFEGFAHESYQKLLDLNYFPALFPETALAMKNDPCSARLIDGVMRSTDTRYHQKKPINPAFLLAVLLWPSVQANMRTRHHEQKPFSALCHGMRLALQQHTQTFPIPRRMSAIIRAMWLLQYHLTHCKPKRAALLVSQRYFRAAYDCLRLRAEAGEPLMPIAQWWDAFYHGNAEKRTHLLNHLPTST